MGGGVQAFVFLHQSIIRHGLPPGRRPFLGEGRPLLKKAVPSEGLSVSTVNLQQQISPEVGN